MGFQTHIFPPATRVFQTILSFVEFSEARYTVRLNQTNQAQQFVKHQSTSETLQRMQ